jgi:hypothetical protein
MAADSPGKTKKKTEKKAKSFVEVLLMILPPKKVFGPIDAHSSGYFLFDTPIL